MLVSIIILNYNTPELVLDCVCSIYHYLTIPFEVIVVDNGSEQRLHLEDFKNTPITYFEEHKNCGFGSGNNRGFKETKGNIIWFLNSDTVLVDGSMNQLFTAFEQQSEFGIISPILYNNFAKKELQPDFYANFQSIVTLVSRKSRPRLAGDREFFAVDVVVGASLIVTRDLFKALEGFDQNIFMFFEDDDLCYRVQKLGKKVGVYTQAQIEHLQGKSIGDNKKRKELYYTSQEYFWRKHYSLLTTKIMLVLRTIYRHFT